MYLRSRLNVSAISTAALISFLLLAVPTGPTHAGEDEAWPDIKDELFQNRKIEESATKIVLHAPNQAADAALVPVLVRLPPQIARNIKSMTLIIDRNPMPVAATFAFAPGYRNGSDIGERVIATRIRVDNFSNVRVVTELNDGTLHMTKQFVFGAGGCSSPSAKDADGALANLGQIRIREKFDDNHAKAWREVRVMVRHPNYTGMQMDAKSGNFTAARFVEKLTVTQNDEPLFQVAAGISLSENPMIRFTYGTTTKSSISVQAEDSDGTVFHGSSTAANGT